MSESTSCIGCKFLYSRGEGYSNWTWMETYVHCAKDRNPNLTGGDAEACCDWTKDVTNDNWPATNTSRCELYAPGSMVTLDVDGEDGPVDYTDDEEAIVAICEHSGRARVGYGV